MSEDFGPTFITVTDEDGKEVVLEFIDALEYNGQVYQAFFPAETEDEEEDPDSGLIILKVVEQDGEELFVEVEEKDIQRVYDYYMENIFDGEDEIPEG